MYKLHQVIHWHVVSRYYFIITISTPQYKIMSLFPSYVICLSRCDKNYVCFKQLNPKQTILFKCVIVKASQQSFDKYKSISDLCSFKSHTYQDIYHARLAEGEWKQLDYEAVHYSYLWELKRKTRETLELTWSVLKVASRYLNISKQSLLCIQEKLYTSTYQDQGELLNKRLELISKFHHENEFLLANCKGNGLLLVVQYLYIIQEYLEFKLNHIYLRIIIT